MAIASLALLNILFIPLGYAEYPRVAYQMQGLNQDLIGPIQQRLDTSLQSLVDPSTEDVQFWYQHSVSEIKQSLAAYGYFKPSIKHSLKKIDANWNARYQISVGPPLKITTLKISVDSPNPDPKITKLMADFPLHRDDIFNSEAYEDAKQKLLAKIVAEGYLSAYYSKHTILINRQAYTAKLILTLNTGPRYYFGSITFQQSILNNSLLQRYIPFKSGDPYSSTRLLKLQDNLNKSGYFQNVSIPDSLISKQNTNLPINFILSPRQSQQYTAGIGYGTDVGIRGTLGWESRYLNKAGHRLSILSQLSKIQNSLQTTYTIPGKHPNTDNYNINFAIVRKKLTQVTTTTQQLGISSLDKWRGWKRNLFLNYQIERFNYLNQPKINSHLLTPGINLSYSKFDNPFFALHGYQLNFRLQGADKNLLSNTSFLQTEIQGKYILSWDDNSRLLFRGNVGYTLTPNLENFPPSLLFYAGGSQSVRGYAYQSLGPARYLMTGSVEYQHRLINNFYGAIFFDAGNAVNNFPINLQKGSGIGLVWASPLGPMEVTAGKALDLPGHPIRFQFTMGFDFL
ncbi:autotransporter assembly complex family protein [Rickettsiella endosymbiont of Miltochrista miniata]|uniref:autotransporter assembly complex protein TamA n=1 Tax=Rickettsiella endosymbiont of Miltochrista miniata TaxID=3066239 RepID=UPI00313E51BB